MERLGDPEEVEAHPQAEARRQVSDIEQENAEFRALLMTAADLCAEASDPDGRGVGYDFRARAATFATEVTRRLVQRSVPTDSACGCGLIGGSFNKGF